MDKLGRLQVPYVFINVTHVIGQPLPISPNAPPLQTPTPSTPAPPPPPGGMVLPPLLPGKPQAQLASSAALHVCRNASRERPNECFTLG